MCYLRLLKQLNQSLTLSSMHFNYDWCIQSSKVLEIYSADSWFFFFLGNTAVATAVILKFLIVTKWGRWGNDREATAATGRNLSPLPSSLKSHIQSGGKMTGNLCHVPCLPKRSLGKVGCDSCDPFLSWTLGDSSTNSPARAVPWGLSSSGTHPLGSKLECSTTHHTDTAASHLGIWVYLFTFSHLWIQDIKNHLLFKEQLLSYSLKRGVLKGYPSHRTNCLVHTLTIKMSIKSIVLYYEVTQPIPFLFLLCPKDYTSRDDKSARKAITNNLNTELFNTVFNNMNSF